MFFTEELIAEYLKCKDDPIYFIEKYIQTYDIDKGLIPVTLSVDQVSIVRRLQDGERSVEKLMRRQSGKTFVALAFIAHYVVFNSDRTLALVGHRMDAARGMLDELKRMIRGLPAFLQPTITRDTKTIIELENGMHVIAVGVGGYQALRGRTINFVYFDEFMWFDRNDWLTFTEAFMPVIMAGKTGRTLFLSSW